MAEDQVDKDMPETLSPPKAPPIAEIAKEVREMESVDIMSSLKPDGKPQVFEVSKGGREPANTSLHLDDVDPLRSADDGFTVGGVPADLLAVVAVGEQKIGVVDTKSANGYGDGYELDETRFMTVGIELTDDGKLIANKEAVAADAYDKEPDTMLHLGSDNDVLGRQNRGVSLAADSKVSSNHAGLRLTEQGELNVVDYGSLNGTGLIVRPKFENPVEHPVSRDRIVKLQERLHRLPEIVEGTGEVAIVGAQKTVENWRPPTHESRTPAINRNVDFANTITPDELVRESGNKGKELAESYIRNQTAAREVFVAGIKDSMYDSTEDFVGVLKKSHVVAAANDVYQEVGTGVHGLASAEHGEFRPDDEKPFNKRTDESKNVAQLAAGFKDGYADIIQYNGEAVNQSRVELAGIPENRQAKSTAFFDEDGSLLKVELDYPIGEAVPAYMEQMTIRGKEIAGELAKAKPDKQRVLELVAEQYQYGAIARPFKQINNSLFMNLANAQLKLAGYDGMRHGQLDHAAQRLQPAAFKQLFMESARQFGEAKTVEKNKGGDTTGNDRFRPPVVQSKVDAPQPKPRPGLIDSVPKTKEELQDLRSTQEAAAEQQRLEAAQPRLDELRSQLLEVQARIDQLKDGLSEDDALILWRGASAYVRYNERRSLGRTQEANNENALYGEARNQAMARSSLQSVFSAYVNEFERADKIRTQIKNTEASVNN